MDKIKIVNCLLTRRCNLNCWYCRLSGKHMNYTNKPTVYPTQNYLFESEKSPQWWIETLSKFHSENRDTFFILYGGEPFLYDGLAEIVKHLNKIGALYTIISNCTQALSERRSKFFEDVGWIFGFTASVDPPNPNLNESEDSQLKSSLGLRVLTELVDKNLVECPVAEVTCTNDNLKFLESTLQTLTEKDIWASISVVDNARSSYYDFSNCTDSNVLVKPTLENAKIFERVLNNPNYKIHAREVFHKTYDSLSQGYFCSRKELTNLSIDSDGSCRLCLRIRGYYLPVEDWFERRESFKEKYFGEMDHLCKGCLWTCPMMSEMLDESDIQHS